MGLAVLMGLLSWLGGFGDGLMAPALAADYPQGAAVAVAQFAELTDTDGERLFRQAFKALQAGDLASADRYFSEAIAQFPDHPAAWSNRGNIRIAQNQLEAAITDYNRAIELAPDLPDAYLNRGIALAGLGQWQAAIANYNQVLSLNPQDADAYNNRGNAYAGLGDWSAAIADYQQAIALKATDITAQTNYALALYQTDRAGEALQTLRRLVRKYPNFADARAALTAVLWAQGQQGEAESNWVAVVGLDPRYQDWQWVRSIRRWPPAMVAALKQFLQLREER
ncbi:tetratricopeptide repeat protein [Trichothermofontia sp.]